MVRFFSHHWNKQDFEKNIFPQKIWAMIKKSIIKKVDWIEQLSHEIKI
jgi:hypothetical protein